MIAATASIIAIKGNRGIIAIHAPRETKASASSPAFPMATAWSLAAEPSTIRQETNTTDARVADMLLSANHTENNTLPLFMAGATGCA
jgi:hypothetical protein